ncbi:MAG: hypothetical protein IT239_07385, partial [Bacteroidia bacterium]|nr:hypothetical protein [Bacteroidia bacterium]
TVNAGNVGGMGVGTASFGSSGGKGINASYLLGNNHRIGAYYTRSPKLFSPFYGYENVGGFYMYVARELRAGASVGHQNNNVRDQKAITFGTTVSYTLKKIHSLSASANGRYIYKSVTPLLTRLDYSGSLRYSGTISKKHQEMLSLNYFEYASQNPKQTLLNIIHRSQLGYIKKYPITVSNNYVERTNGIKLLNGNYGRIFSRGIGNTAATGISLKSGGVLSPSVFYNFVQMRSLWGHSRGGGISYSFFNPDTRLRFSYFAQGGYNLLPGKRLPNTFFFRTAAITQYRTLSLNIRYNYGTGVMDTINTFYTTKYPQSLGINFSYQYLFRDPRFLVMPFINYSFTNVRNRHSIGLFPDFYFFSNNGWRLRFSFGTNFSFTERMDLNRLINPNTPKEERWNRSSGFTFTLGVRKAFGIPIPKKLTKQRFASPTITCFYDFNGDKIFNNNELVIENVVVAIGETKVLSNEDGKAIIENIPARKYKYQVFALEDLGTWYPVYEDSIVISDQKILYVPFVKGVRITGKVVMDREKFANDVEKPLDLSKIKITATDSLGKVYTSITNNKGEFEIFVPYGKYTLHMDESVLSGERYKLLRNDYMVDLKDGIDGIFHTFYIVERKRKLTKKKFGADGKIIEETIEDQKNGKNKNNENPNKQTPADSLLNNKTTGQNNLLDPDKVKLDPKNYTPEELERMRNEFLKSTMPSNQIKGTVFAVQLGAFALPVQPDVFKMVPEQLISERLPNGMVRISSGVFKTRKEAEEYQKMLYNIGYIVEDYVVAYVDGQYRNPAQARKIK